MPVCNCPPACAKSRFNDISLLVLCSSVVGVVVHILLLGGGGGAAGTLLLGGRLLGAALLMLGGRLLGGGGGGGADALHCSCSVVGEDHSLPDHWFLSCCGLRARYK